MEMIGMVWMNWDITASKKKVESMKVMKVMS